MAARRSAPAGGGLAATLARCETAEQMLGAVFALAREESVAEVRVAGEPLSLDSRA